MKHLLLFFITLISCTLSAQDVEELVQEGIVFHDAGNFDGAIQKYDHALEIDPMSELARYEKANTLISLQKYEEAIEICDALLLDGKDEGVLKQAYTLNGNAWDMLGENAKAIDIYKEGIEKFPEDFMLPFNLSITLFQSKDYEGANTYAGLGVQNNVFHPSSHYILTASNYELDLIAKSLMTSYFFLLLEPSGMRTSYAIEILTQSLSGGSKVTSSKKDGENIVNINLHVNENDTSFSTIETTLALMVALSELDKKKDDIEVYAELTETFFSLIAEDKEKRDNLYSQFYMPFYTMLDEKKLSQTYAYYILRDVGNKKVNKYLKKHKTETAQLEETLSTYFNLE